VKAAEKELAELRKLGARLLHWCEPEYPQRLLQIYDPPPLLYVKGRIELLNRHGVALVGTRKPPPYGNQMAERLARGIDSSAHKGALASARAAEGTTVGVLGTAIHVVYPKENKKLFEQMGERACIISEFPLRTFPAPQNFPIRNRIIAGMGLGVVVVEGAQYSGSLITARLAMEARREVYAVPGNVTQPPSSRRTI